MENMEYLSPFSIILHITNMENDKKILNDSNKTVTMNIEEISYDNPVYQSGSQNITQHVNIVKEQQNNNFNSKIISSTVSIVDNEENNYKNVLVSTNDGLRREIFNNGQNTEAERKFSEISDDSRSRWYKCCQKWRAKKMDPAWQPPYWSKYCPYPYCPTYRQYSRVIGFGVICIFLWGVVYAILGATAAPGGQLFQLILLTLCTYIGGYLATLANMPALIGMLSTGIIFQNFGIVHFEDDFEQVIKQLRKIALVVILVRAGLSLDPIALRKFKWTAIKLGLIPWASELPIIAVTTHYLLDLPWLWAFMLGSVIAAVSPAVVVPCLFRLRLKGYGVAKGIPTLIVAAAGMDDAISVAAFGIVKSVIFSNDSLVVQILQGPLSIICSIIFGILWGIFSKYIPDKSDPFVAPLRIISLAIGGLFPVFISELIGYSGAGPLAVVAAAFVSLISWSSYKTNAWSNTTNPATVAFEIFWMVFEPILFGLTGAQVRIAKLDGHIVAIACACIGISLAVRVIVTMFVGMGCGLNTKEKVFIAITWMSKATVQAALGPVALGIVGQNSPHTKDAENVLTVCILSILLTAPAGAILITLLGPKLLTKTRAPTDEVIKTQNPSISDIYIAGMEMRRDDVEIVQNIERENDALDEREIAEKSRL